MTRAASLDAAGWRRRLGRAVILVIALAALGTAALVIYAGGLGAVLAALGRLPPVAVLLAIAAITVEWWTDAWRFAVLGHSLGLRAGPFFWLKLALANMSATYAASAGTPLTGLLLSRRGVNPGEAFAFALIQQSLFVPACLGPACLLSVLYPDTVPPGAFRATLWLAGLVALAVIALLAVLATTPEASQRAALWVTRGRARAEITDFIQGVARLLRGHRLRLAAAVLFSVINQAAVVAASIALLHGLGARGEAPRSWEYSYLLAAVSQASPTPGGAGVSEIGGAWLFRDVLQPSAVALYLVLWRFLAIQLPTLVGAVVIALELRRSDGAV